MFDLTSIKEAGTADIDILHPITRAPTGAVITLMGPEHPARKKVQYERQRKMRAAFSRRGHVEVGDPEEEEQEEVERLASFTVSWKDIGIDGKPLEYSKAAAVDLYGRPEMAWLKRQIQSALNDLENFIQTSPES